MATYNKFNVFTKDLLEGKHQFGTHTFKALFSNSAPDAALDAVKGDVTEIAAGGGYSAGGVTLDSVTVTQVSGSTYKVTIADEVFTATGTVNTFQYIIIYNDSQTTPADPLVCWYNYGSPVNLQDTETFTINFDDTNGLFPL